MRFGTAIAAIWTPKRIFVAADSKTEGDSSPVNKISEAAGIFFTMAGMTASETPPYDAASAIREALEGHGSFKARIAEAIGSIESPLTEAVQFLHDTEPAIFKERFSGKNALDVIFFGKTGDEMSLAHVAFRTKRRGKNVVLDPQRQDFPNAGTGLMSVKLIATGVHESIIAEFFKNTKDQEALVYPEQTLKKFMDVAAAAEPAHVGYPVHLVRLGAAGAEHATIEK